MIFRLQAARAVAVATGAVLVLGACTPSMTAAVASLRQMMPGGTAADSAKLDPSFTYLRVTRGSYVALLWRGSMEGPAEAPVEVYYSSGGEILRMRDGRLVGVSGLATEWRHVADGAPAWNALVKAQEPVAFVRVRDVMPGYRSGVRDELLLTRMPAPERSALRGVDAHSLTWFEERLRERGFRLPGMASDTLPPARYALDLSGASPVVVYSEQCVARDLCFTWQRWSATMQQALARGP